MKLCVSRTAGKAEAASVVVDPAGATVLLLPVRLAGADEASTVDGAAAEGALIAPLQLKDFAMF